MQLLLQILYFRFVGPFSLLQGLAPISLLNCHLLLHIIPLLLCLVLPCKLNKSVMRAGGY